MVDTTQVSLRWVGQPYVPRVEQPTSMLGVEQPASMLQIEQPVSMLRVLQPR